MIARYVGLDRISVDVVRRSRYGIGSAIAFFGKPHEQEVPVVCIGGVGRGDDLCLVRGDFTRGADRARRIVGPANREGGLCARFFGGMLLSAVIDKLVPSYENPHEVKSLESMGPGREQPQPIDADGNPHRIGRGDTQLS